MIEDRKEQIDIAKQIVKAFESVNNVILQAPTGSGKSIIAYHVQRLMNVGGCFLSHQKVLQDQYDETFKDYNNALSIKGQNNYECQRAQHVSVDRAPCAFNGGICDLKGQCEYFQKRKIAKHKHIVLTTYQLIFSLYEAEAFDFPKPLFVFDEAHNIYSVYTDFCKCTLSLEDVEFYENFKKWTDEYGLNTLQSCIEDYIAELETLFRSRNIPDDLIDFEELFELKARVKNEIEVFIKDNLKLLEKRRHLIYFGKAYIKESRDCVQYAKICSIDSYSAKKEYVVEKIKSEDSEEINIIPLSFGNSFKRTLEAICSKRLFMSGTIFGAKKLMEELGLENEKYEFIEVDSIFPIENRAVNSIPLLKMNKDSLDSPKMQMMYDALLGASNFHYGQGHSGVIFTPSYEFSRMLLNKVERPLEKMGFRVLHNFSAKERDRVLNSFRNKDPEDKTILVSPSFYEGVNFEDDISRFQIFLKVPFKSLASKFVKEKLNRDQTWYVVEALKQIVQGCGRSIRHKEDFADTYIFDSHFERIVKQYKEFIPSWYFKAINFEKM